MASYPSLPVSLAMASSEFSLNSSDIQSMEVIFVRAPLVGHAYTRQWKEHPAFSLVKILYFQKGTDNYTIPNFFFVQQELHSPLNTTRMPVSNSRILELNGTSLPAPQYSRSFSFLLLEVLLPSFLDFLHDFWTYLYRMEIVYDCFETVTSSSSTDVDHFP